MIRLLLARHGVTEWNQAGRYQGHRDVPLGDLGRRQAKQLGLRLRSESIDAAYSSDLSRASETAMLAVAGRGIPVECTPMLREMGFGAWEGLDHAEIAARFPGTWAAWVRDPVATRPPNGESLSQLRERLLAFYEAIGESPSRSSHARDWFAYAATAADPSAGRRTILLVTHGGVIRVLLTVLLDIPTERYWRFAVRPASLSILDIYPEGAIAEVIGDTAHLLER